MDLLDNAAYLYSRAIFLSLTMASMHNAIKVLSTYGCIAVVSRIAVVWGLKDVEDLA